MLLASIFIFIIILPFAITGWLFAPWLPISHGELPRLKKLLKLKPTDEFYELGCGDGRVVDYISRTFKCKTVGVELNPILFLFCLGKSGNYILGDLFRVNLKSADCVYLFGLPRAINNRVKDKLEKELKTGAKVVCYGFQIESWKPVKIDKQKNQLPIFLYGLPQS